MGRVRVLNDPIILPVTMIAVAIFAAKHNWSAIAGQLFVRSFSLSSSGSAASSLLDEG